MRENLVQVGTAASDGRKFIEYDWYAGGIPANVSLAENVYLDTSYGFAPFHSKLEKGLVMGNASGAYDRASFIVGENGRITVGEYTVLNGSTIICNNSVTVGDHCLIAWGAVITDTWANFENASIEKRRKISQQISKDKFRRLLPIETPQPVVLEDNVWVGFDAVILPGVTLGRGCIVGCRTIINEDVPPYAVMVGNPPRLIRYLEADDTQENRQRALRERR